MWKARLFAAIMLAAGVASCRSAPRRETVEMIRIPFDFDVKDELVPRNPVVSAEIGGRRVLLLLDTGANGQVLDRGLALGLGLKAAPAEAGQDHYGNKVATEDLPSVPISLGRWRTELAHPTAIPRPQSLRERGILGTLSPQNLLETGVVMLDLSARELLIAPTNPRDLDRWLKEVFPGRDFAALPTRMEQQSLEVVVPAALKGRAKVPVLLDTGSGSTEFSDDYAKDGVRDGIVELAGRELKVARIEVRSFKGQAYMSGILGLDGLRGLVLVFPQGRARVLLGFAK
ncbi:MAG: retropepsin-like domain-containing protein [Elusimicrobia bacterium]|nr:retropepsin-like domain-containing protein [Elusimicrobiota bacterium]